MKAHFLSVVMTFILIVASSCAAFSAADEHPGEDVKEHPGEEELVKGEDVKKAIGEYVKNAEGLGNGYLTVKDEKLGKDWKLKFSKFHMPVRHIKDKDVYFMCTDFVTPDKSATLDLDFWVKQKKGKLIVTEVKIHKVDGKERFVYEGGKLKVVK